MADTKFTPGPWLVGFPSGDGSKVKPGLHGIYIVATSYEQDTTREHVVVWAQAHAETPQGVVKKADAHLIAAAPELYAALKEVEWQTKIVDDTLVLACPRCTSIDGDHFPGCQLDAALRKARGEA